MRAELLDVYRDRCSDPLGAEHVEPCWRAIRIGPQRKPVFRARLVRGDERRCVLDRRGWTGEMDDARSGHLPLRWLLPATGISPDIRPIPGDFGVKIAPLAGLDNHKSCPPPV